MLTQVEVENFQSIKKLSLKLGKFTVVTGATGSGKSALRRALELLAFNARGTAYITTGAKVCQAGAGDSEQGWFTAITRSVSRGKDSYRIARAANDEPEVDAFTKLAGGVPGQVTALLQLSELNFAGQFDKPYLLDSSGGEIARVLGKLTNVTLLFDAAREASRRRLEVMGDLKRAEENLAHLTEAAQRFRGMRERRAAVSEAEEALERVHGINVRLGRLRALTDRLVAAEAALERAVPPEVPSAEKLDELAGRLARVRSLYARLDESALASEGARFAAEQAAKTEQAAHGRLHEVLVEAGQCPTCGSVIPADSRAS